jgi:hypothetical protein
MAVLSDFINRMFFVYMELRLFIMTFHGEPVFSGGSYAFGYNAIGMA